MHLNGAQIGVLAQGPNDSLNAGDLFTLAPPSVVAGENTIEFRQSVPGWTWGVTNLGVLSAVGTPLVIALTVDDLPHTGMYGHNYGTSEHETLLAATFTGDGTSIYYLQATGYDIDYNDEISVWLNGTQIGVSEQRSKQWPKRRRWVHAAVTRRGSGNKHRRVSSEDGGLEMGRNRSRCAYRYASWNATGLDARLG